MRTGNVSWCTLVGLSLLSGCQVPITIARAWEVKNVHMDGDLVKDDVWVHLDSRFDGVVELEVISAGPDKHGIMHYPKRVERVDILKAIFGPLEYWIETRAHGGLTPPEAILSTVGVRLQANSRKVLIENGVVKCTLVWITGSNGLPRKVVRIGKGHLTESQVRQLVRKPP